MNNLEYLFTHDRERILRNLTMEDDPCRICPKHDVTNPDVCDSGRCTEVMREWLLAEHVDDESCRQDADQPKREESPDCESDSREKLEADVLVNFGDGLVRSIIMRLLERQAAITSKEWCWTNDSLQEQVDMLTEQRDRWHGNWTERNVEYNDLADEYDELKAERDELKNKLETLKSYGVEIVDAVAGGYEVYNEAIRERDHYIELFHEQEHAAYELKRKLEASTDANTDYRDEWHRVCAERANLARDLGNAMAERDRYRELCGELLDAADEMRRVRDQFDAFTGVD